MLLHLDNKFAPVGTLNFQGIVDFRQHLLSVLSLSVEEHVDDRTDNLRNVSTNLCHKLSFYKINLFLFSACKDSKKSRSTKIYSTFSSNIDYYCTNLNIFLLSFHHVMT